MDLASNPVNNNKYNNHNHQVDNMDLISNPARHRNDLRR